MITGLKKSDYEILESVIMEMLLDISQYDFNAKKVRNFYFNKLAIEIIENKKQEISVHLL
jgi:hypothetical protein